jgi:hypothetical protein
MKRIAGVILCGVLAAAAPALADAVTGAVVDWNRITVDAVTGAYLLPVPSGPNYKQIYA